MVKIKKSVYLGIIITVAVFWILDFIFHSIGVGETNYYFLSKFANSLLFAILWFFVFSSKSHLRKIVYSFIFGTWISFYYLVSAYSGLVQILGVSARYTPPPFVIFGVFYNPVVWWFFHAFVFYLGLEISGLIVKK